MRLKELIEGLEISVLDAGASGELDSEIREVRDDSRTVQPGDLFVALRGQTVDGHDFLRRAADQGARTAIVERAASREIFPGTQIVVPSCARALPQLAANRYQRPAEALELIGITGTNGKTTTTFLAEALIRHGGGEPGVIGTVTYRHHDHSRPAPLTTPTPLELHATLDEMRRAGCTHVAMECSSHALALHRLEGVRFRVGAFTNLTQDHLDFHPTMEAYRDAKALLFRDHLRPDGCAVVLIDSEHGRFMADAAPGRALTVTARPEGADVAVKRATFSIHGIEAELTTPWGALELKSPLIGPFNLENLVVAVGIGLGLGLGVHTISEALGALTGVPGRLERVPNDEGLDVFVDYAHTPDALERAIAALRPLTKRRLMVVFGCGGDRDRSKRPKMGMVAAAGADVTIVTSDNPRTEEPSSIIEMILEGVRLVQSPGIAIERLSESDKGHLVFVDRRQAIEAALAGARPGDVVLIAGKGHEDYQIVGHTKHHFDDREESAAVLQKLTNLRQRTQSEAMEGRLALSDLLAATGGTVTRSGPSHFSAATIDGRAVPEGALFFAIKGQRFDGHDFVLQAAQAGAAGAVVARGRAPAIDGLENPHFTIVEVDDPVAALGQFARAHRAQHAHVKVIAITGSNGKTTTKEMMAAILSAAHPPDAILRTDGNLNNHLGVPLTLLRIERAHRFAVIEMGMSALGEIAYLADLAKPDVSVVVNVAGVHLETLETIENVARAKGEIFAPDAFAILPIDEPLLLPFVAATPPERRLTFGAQELEPTIGYADLSTGLGGLRFRLQKHNRSVDVEMPLVGGHHAKNATAAAAAADALGLDLATIARGLRAVEPTKHRTQIVGVGGRMVFDDCYNASPLSTRAALDALTTITQPGHKRVAVLGDMLELGKEAVAFHQEIGRYAAQRVDEIIAMGPLARHLAEAARAHLGAEHVLHTDDPRDAAEHILAVSGAGDAILVKASRGMRLERVIEALEILSKPASNVSES
jgi:murE/murF fusion protein